jgi:glycosyltransferase involved in cell wall biosynthesis
LSAGKPKLAYVVHSLNPGGTEKLAMQMALEFSEEFEIEVCCLDEPGLWASDLRRRGIRVECFWRQPGFDWRLVVRLARWFRESRFDLVHAHQYTAWFYAALARILCRRPRLLFEEHGRFYPEMDNWRRRLVNRMLIEPLSHHTVAVSQDVRERLVRYEGLDRGRISIIYNGTPQLERLSGREVEDLRATFGFDESHFVVGTVGRFDAIKNLPMLARAFTAAAARNPKLRLLLVGDGPERAAIADLLTELGVESHSALPGFRDDARDITQCMDLFVLASFSEGTSMALIDAMAAGVPVAVTAVGGNVEVVDAGTSGWVVPSDDEAALSDAICEASDSAEQRSGYAEVSRRLYEERFSLEGMLEAYRRCYGSLLAGIHLMGLASASR